MMETTDSGRQIKKTKGAHTASNQADDSTSKRVHWSEHMQKILIDLYSDERRSGGCPDIGLKSQQWSVVMAKFNEDSGYRPLDKEQLQSQINYLRKKWTIFHAIVTNCSGWGWDEARSRPTCPSTVWEAYCKAHHCMLQDHQHNQHPQQHLHHH